jgi:hypothetical protein
MQYGNKSLTSTMLLFINGCIILSLFAVPEMVWANRLEKIAEAMAAGADQKIKDLIEVTITASLIFPLFLMLYWITEKKGLVRLVGFIGAGALGYALYMLHFG